MQLLKVRNLTYAYKDKLAVNHINMDINKGDLVAFLGANGAGKSTTMRMLTGITKPNQGSISLNGLHPSDVRYRNKIGIVFQNGVLDNNLTVKQNLDVRCKMYHHIDKSFVDKLINMFGIKPFFKQIYGSLSGGQRKRVDIVRSLINKPQLLFLDEPSTGLDLPVRKEIWHVLNILRRKYQLTILLTTHYLEEANQADYVYIINRGSIIAHDTVSHLKQEYTGYILTITSKHIAKIKSLIKKKYHYSINHNKMTIIIPNLQDGITFLNQIKSLITDASYRRGDMNNIFLDLLGGEMKS